MLKTFYISSGPSGLFRTFVFIYCLGPELSMAWVYQDCGNSPPILGTFGAVFPGHRQGARVVPHPALCELSSRRKPGSFGANLVAVLGPARPAGSSSRSPKPDIDCYCNPDRPNPWPGLFKSHEPRNIYRTRIDPCTGLPGFDIQRTGVHNDTGLQ